jgi:hypothetical protein
MAGQQSQGQEQETADQSKKTKHVVHKNSSEAKLARGFTCLLLFCDQRGKLASQGQLFAKQVAKKAYRG